MSQLLVLLQIARRNLFASFLNVIIGVIILGGTFFFVVGSTLLTNIDKSMSQSIIGSISGHVQVFSANSKEDLALYNDFGPPDVAAMPDFSKVKASLEKIENVKTVVPMGLNGAMLTYGNTMDETLEKLRNLIKKQQAGDHSSELKAKIESIKSHARQIVSIIQKGYDNQARIGKSNETKDSTAEKDLARASDPKFWQNFDHDVFQNMEFLENKIAQLVPDADFIYLSYLGTDLDVFQKSFDRMKLVDGTLVPSGKRGMLLSKQEYENQFKLKVARRLDRINEMLTQENKKIAKDPDIQQFVKRNRAQNQELILQLDPLSTSAMIERLQKFLDSKEKDLPKLLDNFFNTTDENFKARFDFFYKEMAPLVELYRLHPGDMLTVKAYTKSGFVKSINVKVYGTFQFSGLEKSALAGSYSLMDLMSFRDLYGYMTPDKLAEMKEIEKESGAKIISRDQAEDALFGGTASAEVKSVKQATIDDKKAMGTLKRDPKSGDLVSHVYTSDEINGGMALNAALILKDPKLIKQTMKEVQAVADRDHLDLKTIDWQKAAGNLGQFVFVAKAVLYAAVFIIFIVALVIINNAVMMVTLQRIREIGTMRAIGAQRSFVLSLILLETITLGFVFGALGIGLGAAFIGWLGKKGIPAANDFLYFFFSGPRLFPVLGFGSIAVAFAIVLVVTLLSALYPALIATRVSPLQAMQSED